MKKGYYVRIGFGGDTSNGRALFLVGDGRHILLCGQALWSKEMSEDGVDGEVLALSGFGEDRLPWTVSSIRKVLVTATDRRKPPTAMSVVAFNSQGMAHVYASPPSQRRHVHYIPGL